MNSFEKINFEKPGDRVIRNIFTSQGRAGFIKKTEEVFNWSEKGGPRVGTSLFIKGIVGNVKLKPEEFAILKKEINQEIKKIKKAKERKELKENNHKKEEKRKLYEKISQNARDDFDSELKRSGGINPNEL
jgi:hypothetical protein